MPANYSISYSILPDLSPWKLGGTLTNITLEFPQPTATSYECSPLLNTTYLRICILPIILASKCESLAKTSLSYRKLFCKITNHAYVIGREAKFIKIGYLWRSRLLIPVHSYALLCTPMHFYVPYISISNLNLSTVLINGQHLIASLILSESA